MINYRSKNGDLSLKHAGGFMFVDNLYCVHMLVYINSCKHIAQCTGVISNLLYFNSGDTLLQHFEHSSLVGRILHHWVSG